MAEVTIAMGGAWAERPGWSVQRRRRFVLRLFLPTCMLVGVGAGALWAELRPEPAIVGAWRDLQPTAFVPMQGAISLRPATIAAARVRTRTTVVAAATATGGVGETTRFPLDTLAAESIPARAAPPARPVPKRWPKVLWRDSTAVGSVAGGSLVNGVRLTPYNKNFYSYDAVHLKKPNPAFRRWGTDALVRRIVEVAKQYRLATGQRMGVADMSLQHGGFFGAELGGLGHKTHQNGLDVDVNYPRKDGKEAEPLNPAQIDHKKALLLLNLWLDAGANVIYVGYNSGMPANGSNIRAIPSHDDHMHVNILPG